MVLICGRWGRFHLDDHKARAACVGTCEVDSGLVAGDVEPLDGGTLLDLGWSRCGKAEDGGDGEGRELHVGDLNQIVDTTEKDWRTIIGGTTSLYIC